MKYISLLIPIFCSISSWAGISELGLSTSYRETLIGENTKSISQSITGTYSFYFAEMSAIEISYTSGKYESTYTDPLDTNQQVRQTALSEYYGLEFVFAFADRQSSFQPYVKVGAIHMDKEYFFADVGDSAAKPTDFQIGWAPSAGVGFKLKLTKTFSLKLSLNTWSSPIDDDRHDTTYDTSTKVGISWYL